MLSEKSHKIDQSLASLTKKKREHTISLHQNWKNDITTDPTDIERIADNNVNNSVPIKFII